MSFDPHQFTELTGRRTLILRLAPVTTLGSRGIRSANCIREIGVYDEGYFFRPVLGHLPRNQEEQYLETMLEKRCRCQLHILGSYIFRIVQAHAEEEDDEEERKRR